MRKKRVLLLHRQTGLSNFTRKKESSVYPSVGKNRPPFSLGKENRS